MTDETKPIPQPAPEPAKPQAVVKKPDAFPQVEWDKLDDGSKRGIWWVHQSLDYKKKHPFTGKEVI